MSAEHGGDLIARILGGRGVEFLFTLCGGHISPILVGAKQRGIRVIDVRHEATAVFAADAVARLTGRPGVAAVTAGPGATNALTAIKNTQLAQSPVVVLAGATATILKGRGALQDIDHLALTRPHVKRAFSIAHLGDVPGPVFVECPADVLYPADVVRAWYESARPKSEAAPLGHAPSPRRRRWGIASAGAISGATSIASSATQVSKSRLRRKSRSSPLSPRVTYTER
jgi:thiamine pyrophosphate-dependent acetolactate synthase large subunit-like protein